MTDTSRPGGLYKDQLYLEGAIRILSMRNSLNFKSLLCGKLSLEDYHRPEINSKFNYENQVLPLFMHDMVKYHFCLDQIARVNHIEDIEIVIEDPTIDN